MADTKIKWATKVWRFLRYVHIQNDYYNCWEWEGGLFNGGYGQFRDGLKKVKAHRFIIFEQENSLIYLGDELPASLLVYSSCKLHNIDVYCKI